MKTYNLTIMGIMLLLFPLATMFRSGNIFAADPPKSEYEAAMSAIEDGKYYLVTEVGETKWYLTQDGYLTDDMEKAYLYDVSKESGGDLYNIVSFWNPITVLTTPTQLLMEIKLICIHMLPVKHTIARS
jgi:hypothetical protein